MDISEAQQIAHDNALDKGFWDNTDIPTKLMLIVTEVAEAMEEYRVENETLTTVRYRLDGKPEGFPTELADIVIRVFDLAAYLDIDLDDLVYEKMQFNTTREFLHGKNV